MLINSKLETLISNIGDGDSYIDTIIDWCEKNDIPIDSVAASIKRNPLLLMKLQEEAEYLNFIKKTKKLPLYD